MELEKLPSELLRSICTFIRGAWYSSLDNKTFNSNSSDPFSPRQNLFALSLTSKKFHELVAEQIWYEQSFGLGFAGGVPGTINDGTAAEGRDNGDEGRGGGGLDRNIERLQFLSGHPEISNVIRILRIKDRLPSSSTISLPNPYSIARYQPTPAPPSSPFRDSEILAPHFGLNSGVLENMIHLRYFEYSTGRRRSQFHDGRTPPNFAKLVWPALKQCGQLKILRLQGVHVNVPEAGFWGGEAGGSSKSQTYNNLGNEDEVMEILSLPSVQAIVLEQCNPTCLIKTLLKSCRKGLRSLTMDRPLATMGGLGEMLAADSSRGDGEEEREGKVEIWELENLELGDFTKWDLEDLSTSFEAFKSFNKKPFVTSLTFDCASFTAVQLLNMLSSLSSLPLTRLSLLSTPDQEYDHHNVPDHYAATNPHNPQRTQWEQSVSPSGPPLFKKIAECFEALRGLTVFRGAGFELLKWMAPMREYAIALSELKGLRMLSLNQSDGFHSVGTAREAAVFGEFCPALKLVSFRAKVQFGVSITYQIVRDDDLGVNGVRAVESDLFLSDSIPYWYRYMDPE